MSNLYKEAIADARKLREVAEQNAKNRIIEAVTPKLRALIERSINEGDEELVDDLEGTDLLDAESTMDLFDEEESFEEPAIESEPMDIGMGSLDVDSDGLASLEIIDDEDSEEESSEEGNKSVHVNITVEGKRNKILRHRAIRLVKALSEAKTRAQRNKIRKQLTVLREALIITENSQNKRLANNLSVILKESTMRRRKNSWLFEGEEDAGKEETFEDFDFDDEGFEDEGKEEEAGGETIEVNASALEDALGLEAGTLSGGSSDDDEIDFDDEEEESDEDEAGDETYESVGMQESDKYKMEDDECDDEDEIVEISESMLRRAIRGTRNNRKSRRTLSENRRARIARARRRRRLAEGEAKSMAKSFGGGKLGKEMFVEVDENTLLNALAEELGAQPNATAAQGSASKMAGSFGGGSIKKGAVMEARAHRKTKRVLAETKRRARLVAKKARAAKAELKESNLFNAKLLYVNKLMQQHTLNNKQQRAIIEAMDNAKTQREAKLLFTSLTESLNKKAAKATSSKSLNENASRTGSSSRSLQSGQATRSNGVELDRWAVLAGIRK